MYLNAIEHIKANIKNNLALSGELLARSRWLLFKHPASCYLRNASCPRCIQVFTIRQVSASTKIRTSLWCICKKPDRPHYNDVIMGSMVSQITSLTIVYSAVYSGADQRKHQSSASLVFVRWIHRGQVNSPHKGPLTRKMFPFHDVIMQNTMEPPDHRLLEHDITPSGRLINIACN